MNELNGGLMLNSDAAIKTLEDNADLLGYLSAGAAGLYIMRELERRQKQKGSGIYDKFVNMFGDKKNDLFEGEKHIPLYTKEGFKMGQFIGPQTQLIRRLKRGDKGISDVDRTALVHDGFYTLAKTPEDVYKADMHMLKAIDRIEQKKSDNPLNIALARRGIQAKLVGEKIGLLQEGSFSSKLGGKDLSPSDKQLLITEMNKMIMKGYGFNI